VKCTRVEGSGFRTLPASPRSVVLQGIAECHAPAMSDLPLRIKDVVAHCFAEGFEGPHALAGLGNDLLQRLGFGV
jgi:hypothetical protein